MKPESGKSLSIWADTFTPPQFPSLEYNIETDVCIIGAGITGISAGYFLAKEGKKVVIIDDGSVGDGETGRTTAHISSVIDDRYYEMERLHGEDATRLAAESQIEAINTIENNIIKENISCDFSRINGYLFFEPDDSSDLIEYDAAIRAGLEVEICKSPLKELKYYRCLKFPNQAQFHVLKYISALASVIIKSEGRIFTFTAAAKISDNSPVKVETQSGHIILAKDIIVATNSPISNNVLIHTKQAAYRTYVIGLKVQKNSVKEALYWDNKDPYHYVRVYSKKNYDILIIGGEDHKTGQEDNPEEKYMNLEDWTRGNFKCLGEVIYKWSGQVMESLDGLSFIGKDPEYSDHVYFATGDSGMGMTHGTFAGLILRDLIMQRENPWAELYNPNRVTLKAAPEFIKEGVNFISQYIDLLTPGDIKI